MNRMERGRITAKVLVPACRCILSITLNQLKQLNSHRLLGFNPALCIQIKLNEIRNPNEDDGREIITHNTLALGEEEEGGMPADGVNWVMG